MALSIAIACVVNSYFCIYRVKQNSMVPALCNGDYVVVRRRTSASESEAGQQDVGVFDQSLTGVIVKRIIAMPGDQVQSMDGKLLINNVRETTSYLCANEVSARKLDSVGTITVPQGQIFVAGDNRRESLDSRDFGPVGIETLIGKVVYVWKSPFRSRCECG